MYFKIISWTRPTKHLILPFESYSKLNNTVIFSSIHRCLFLLPMKYIIQHQTSNYWLLPCPGYCVRQAQKIHSKIRETGPLPSWSSLSNRENMDILAWSPHYPQKPKGKPEWQWDNEVLEHEKQLLLYSKYLQSLMPHTIPSYFTKTWQN